MDDLDTHVESSKVTDLKRNLVPEVKRTRTWVMNFNVAKCNVHIPNLDRSNLNGTTLVRIICKW